MDIRDKQFLLGTVGKLQKFIGVRLGVLPSYLLSLKESVNFLKTNLFRVRVVNPPTDYSEKLNGVKLQLGGVIEAINKLDKEPIKPEPIDFNPINEGLNRIETAIESLNFPETKIDFSEVIKQLKAVKEQIAKIPEPKEVVFPPAKEIKIPPFPSKLSLTEAKEIIRLLGALRAAIADLPSKMSKNGEKPVTIDLVPLLEAIKAIPQPKVEFPDEIKTHVISEPPRKIPQPVTNININPLRGLVHTTNTTVTSTLSKLPGYGELDNRRSIIFFNNSSATTVYIGGSSVTSSNGLPVLAQTYSPAIDSGPTQKWYGVTVSGSADVRCVEVQNESGG